MHQTLLRLEMIKLAISAGDFDVVHLLQVKIALLTHDEALQHIAETLHQKNYVAAQQLIDDYLADPPEIPVTSPFEDDEALKEELELFEVSEDTNPQPSDMPRSKNENDNLDALLALPEEEDTLSEQFISNLEDADEFDRLVPPLDTKAAYYEPIDYIEQKYHNLSEQYPPVEDAPLGDEALEWMRQLKERGCTEPEIEETIERVFRLKEENLGAEAAHLLLLSVATDALYPRYILARELYKGEILKPDRAESFRLMYDLAENESYPEAMCDLAQFYETGIETDKDLKKAERLYKQAMHLGIKRAERHYMRLHKKNRGLLSFLRR